ncbi:MAG: hypothetical protein LH473_04520, partial [Chitinophagales bacterium]|nr:hypothetical protein [Chitinophagales bacterium]
KNHKKFCEIPIFFGKNKNFSSYMFRFKNELEGFAISNLNVNVFTTDGGSSWLRADETDTFGLPEFNGYYKTVDGYNDMYLIGEDGYVVKWK